MPNATMPAKSAPPPVVAVTFKGDVIAAALAKAKIWPDIVLAFTPTVPVTFAYQAGQPLMIGQQIKAALGGVSPIITIGGNATTLYTVIMIDPDVPTPQNPHLKEGIHTIITNVPGGSTVTPPLTVSTSSSSKAALPGAGKGTPMKNTNNIVLGYIALNPKGKHRYVVLVYAQIGPFQPVAPASRLSFTTKNFAMANKLGVPVGGFFFYAQK